MVTEELQLLSSFLRENLNFRMDGTHYYKFCDVI
jgi:hypothetical protein